MPQKAKRRWRGGAATVQAGAVDTILQELVAQVDSNDYTLFPEKHL
jgi:hypothetical protein